MKTIQISDGLWKRLKVASVERGLLLRDVMEQAGVEWLDRPVLPPFGAHGYEIRDAVSREAFRETAEPPVESAQALAKQLGLKTGRELTVEPLEE